jgi:hypothetical protein
LCARLEHSLHALRSLPTQGRSAFEPSRNAPPDAETETGTDADARTDTDAKIEPPSQSQSHSPPRYAQLESSHAPLPPAYTHATANNYVQLYDDRGNPINPRSHQYGRSLRDAQNDVLASVGVVERRRSPQPALPASYNARLEELEAEDTAGNVLALTSTIAENAGTWWIGAIRDRILTFRFPAAARFSDIVAAERAAAGPSLHYTGFAARLLSTVSIQAVVYSAHVYRPIDRLVQATRASSKTRQFLRRANTAIRFTSRLVLEVLCYPLSYHACLQRLGLIPAKPFLPHWRAFIPFSQSSPLLPYSVHYSASSSAANFFKATLTSPLVLLCAEHFYERWIYALLFEAVETFVLRPDNADIESPDASSRDRATAMLGMRRQSPPLIRNAVNKLLCFLGWGKPLAPPKAETNGSAGQPRGEGDDVGVGSSRVTSLARLDIPLARADSSAASGEDGENVISIPIEALDDFMRPTTPPTPTTSDHDDNDPRIRITSREGIVEMEVRLPPRILSTHTQVAGEGSRFHDGVAWHNGEGARAPRAFHRVTQLSTEPSQMIGAVVKAQLVGLAVLPFKLVVLRLVACHYQQAAGGAGGAGGMRVVLGMIGGMDEWSWQSVGLQVSRVALCSALELAIDLSMWSVQYWAVARVGSSLFGWGRL